MLISTAKYAPLDSEPLLITHDEVKRAVVVVVTSDRGLAGGFNSNVLREAEKLIKAKEKQGIEVEVIACGKKAIGYFNYRGVKPSSSSAICLQILPTKRLQRFPLTSGRLQPRLRERAD